MQQQFNRINQKWAAWQRRSWLERWLLLEALFWLGVSRWALNRRPFKAVAAGLGEVLPADSNPPPGQSSAMAQQIGRAVESAARYTPWESVCLPQALAAQRMLSRRGVGGTLYLGVSHDDENSNKLKAHAWTRCGDDILTGKAGHEAFTVVSLFVWADNQAG